jgi:two-component system, NarL family, response regulator DegU
MTEEVNKMKILLCDDNDHFRQLLMQFINSIPGFEVVGEAIDGIDVIEKTESLKPDLVLMDLSMPNQSGLDAAKTIKDKWPKIFVIILTLYEDNVYRELAEEFQADGFVAKSSIKSQLPEILKEKLNYISKN